MRVDAYQASLSNSSSSEYALEPRIGLNYLLSPETKFHVYYGRLFQPPLFESLHDSFAKLAAQAGQTVTPYDIKSEKDNYYEAGVEQKLGESHVATVTAYYKDATISGRCPASQHFSFAAV